MAMTPLPAAGEPEGRALAVTRSGTIVGTVQYMAPEQIEGTAVDARTDIFAFGALLYEMVSGRRAFDGASVGSVIAAIAEREPPRLSSVQPLVSPALDRIVATCLAKHPDDRWQTARDLMRELQWVGQATPGRDHGGAGAHSRSRWIAAAALAGLALFAGGFAVARSLRPAPAAEPLVLDVVPPPDTTLVTTTASIPAAQLALSPDGRHLAFVVTGLDGRRSLWVRTLGSGSLQRLEGSDGAAHPFWSADGRSIGFFATGKLKRTDLGGGSPSVVSDVTDGRGGSWNAAGDIIFATNIGGLFRVPAAGGMPQRLTTLDAARGENTHRWPSFLPDGRHFIYVARSPRPLLRFGSLDGDAPALTVEGMFEAAVVTPGYLLFVRNRALVAQRLDLQRFELSGEPHVLVSRIGTSSYTSSAFSVSSTGVLAYAADLSTPGQLTWFDRDGRVLSKVGAVGDTLDFELSPDARRLLVSRTDEPTSTADVWMVDLERGTESRFTLGPRIEAAALWDPARSRIVFRSDRRGAAELWVKSTTGSEEETMLVEGSSANATSWSPDGGMLLYNESSPTTGWDIRRYSTSTNETAPYIETAFNELGGRFSPDGRWVAYASDESGQWQVYVRPSSASGERVTLSHGGGFEPRWRADGRELFYVTPDRQIVAVEIRVTDTLHPGTPRRLFDARIDPLPAPLAVSSGFRRTYTVTPDGQRFLVNVLAREQNTQAMSVVLNWPARLHAAAK